MAFKTIHTQYGLVAMARAEASGTPINLIHMAVGDGNGSPTTPDWMQTGLIRERYRNTVNRVYQSPNDPTHFTVELVIPASAGGWVMREIGVFDASGSLFAVGNLPETYKPTATEGAFADAVVRLEFVVSNASVVTLMVDPNVAVASQAWVINNMTAAQVIPGGTVGQLLGKASNADGDFKWESPSAINVTVDTVAEKQILAQDQTVVDLSITTTYGLAVYIEGLRIDVGTSAIEWTADQDIPTRLHLGQSYAAGTRITLVNNEPAGSAPAPLERSQNLADVFDKAKARDNLEIFSKSETRQMAPVGIIGHFARSNAPAGWLKANGAAISRSVYAELYAAVGTTYGGGDGFTTFNVPDLRGEFVRGWDDGRGVDGGRELGSGQLGSNQSHSHGATAADAGNHTHTGSTNNAGAHTHSGTLATAYGGNQTGFEEGRGWPDWITGNMGSAGDHNHTLAIEAAGSHNHAITINTSGGTEARPRNIALLACIKF